MIENIYTTALLQQFLNHLMTEPRKNYREMEEMEGLNREQLYLLLWKTESNAYSSSVQTTGVQL